MRALIRGAILFSFPFFCFQACTFPVESSSSEQTKIQYVPDMADTSTIKTHREYLDPPEGSVPLSMTFYPKTPDDAEGQLANPLEATEYHLAKGKALWETYCFTCHGLGAKGDSYLGENFPLPPNLTMDAYKSRKDGFFFHKITFGSAIMPAYGNKIMPEERWQIVLYLRQLQAQGG